MTKAQTTVEWLMENIDIDFNPETNTISMKKDIWEKALAIEKEQKKHAYAKCYTPFSFGRIGDLNQDFEKYYKETYENN